MKLLEVEGARAPVHRIAGDATVKKIMSFELRVVVHLLKWKIIVHSS